MLVVGENAGKHISDFSGQFQSEFVTLLSRRFGTKRVQANRVYQEYIQDKQHLHMNATRWVTLTEFCKHLGRCGIAKVDETEKGWFLAWNDNSPKALAKAEASMKKERATTSDEQRERTLISEQIERATAEQQETRDASEESDKTAVEEGLKRSEGEKVVLSLSIKPIAPAAESTPSTTPSGGFKFNALKSTNPLKRPNVFKSKVTNDKEEAVTSTKRKDAPLSVAEQIIVEEQERKRRKVERDAQRA